MTELDRYISHVKNTIKDWRDQDMRDDICTLLDQCYPTERAEPSIIHVLMRGSIDETNETMFDVFESEYTALTAARDHVDMMFADDETLIFDGWEATETTTDDGSIVLIIKNGEGVEIEWLRIDKRTLRS